MQFEGLHQVGITVLHMGIGPASVMLMLRCPPGFAPLVPIQLHMCFWIALRIPKHVHVGTVELQCHCLSMLCYILLSTDPGPNRARDILRGQCVQIR